MRRVRVRGVEAQYKARARHGDCVVTDAAEYRLWVVRDSLTPTDERQGRVSIAARRELS